MELAPSRRQGRVLLATAIAAALAALVIVTGQLPGLAADSDDTSGHEHHAHATAGNPAPTVEALTGRSSSPDDIRAQLRLRLDQTGPTNVMNLTDVDQLQLLELTFEPGQLVDWHVHPGPVIVIVDEGVLTVTSADDCVAREYGPSEVYIEQGPGDPLRVENLQAEGDTVIYALFFDLPDDPDAPITIFTDDPGC